MQVSMPDTNRIIQLGINASRTGKQNPYYTRVLKKLAPHAREEVLAAIAASKFGVKGNNGTNGHHVEVAEEEDESDREEHEREQRDRKPRVIWGMDAWDQFIALVVELREEQPTLAVSSACKQAMEMMPPYLQKCVSGNLCLEVSDKLKAHAKAIRVELHKYAKLKEASSERPPTREEVLENLTDSELVSLAWRVIPLTPLAEIVHACNVLPETFLEEFSLPVVLGFAARKLCEGFNGKFTESLLAIAGASGSLKLDVLRRNTQQLDVPKVRLPRVVIVGPKGDQKGSLEKRLDGLCTVTFAEPDRSGQYVVPTSSDLVVLWTKFISHQINDSVKRQVMRMPNATLMLVPGGLETISDRVKEALDSRAKS